MSAASLKAASSTAVKSKCSPGERCAGPGATTLLFCNKAAADCRRLFADGNGSNAEAAFDAFEAIATLLLVVAVSSSTMVVNSVGLVSTM